MIIPSRLALLLPLLTIGAAPGERVIRAGVAVPTTVAGAAATVLIDPGAPSMMMVSKEIATRAALKEGPFRLSWMVGPVRVPASTAVVRVNLGAGEVKKRIGWTDRPYVTGADGAIGPGGLEDDVVRFVLRDTRAGERVSMLPMLDGGGLFGGAVGLFGAVDLGGEPMRVRFDLRRARTLASAPTANTLARIHDGRLSPDVARAEIAFGVERPVRTMTLARPLMIGSLAIARVAVRTTDHGNAEGIMAEGSTPDPDEVIVTAKGKRREMRITVGTDDLAGCSWIVFDKRAKQIRLSCA
jgi:hypothetical protein